MGHATIPLQRPSTLRERRPRVAAATGSRICGIGSSVPPKILTNYDLEKIVDTSDEWIRTRTGIGERHFIADGVEVSDLIADAGKKAMADAGVTPAEIDALIVATATPETLVASTACWAQPKLGLGKIPVFDLSAACSGWLYGLIVADSMVRSGTAQRVLLVGAEVLSRVINWDDRSTCVLFGDGAAATIIGAPGGPNHGMVAHTWGADGSLAELLWQPGGGTRFQASYETVDKNMHTVHMQGNEVYKHAVRAMQHAVAEVLDKAGATADDVDLFVPHQANIRIMNATAERAGIPPEKCYSTIQKYGNVSAASIPIALSDAVEHGRIKPGDLVLTAAFGAGFTWGAALLRW